MQECSRPPDRALSSSSPVSTRLTAQTLFWWKAWLKTVTSPGSAVCNADRMNACFYRDEWQHFGRDVATAEKMVVAAEGGIAFAFVEGALVKAVRTGSWLLLDEINLAPPEASATAQPTHPVEFKMWLFSPNGGLWCKFYLQSSGGLQQ